jgi:AraC family transcriptional regulator of adaptative response/methylated-DNA-[protein]-cysteine methyltransferase
LEFESKKRSFCHFTPAYDDEVQRVQSVVENLVTDRGTGIMSGMLRQSKPIARQFTTDDDRWQAVVHRDAVADGSFFYSVRSTGVYCRPACPAKLPLRKNVRFHATRKEAERAGFRPCKRCRPAEEHIHQRHSAAVATACRQIEQAEHEPRLADLARSAGMSRYYFHRLFKAHTGVTPKAYAAAERAKRARKELARGDTVTQSIYAAGYNSNGRFYSSGTKRLGMTPSAFRAGGKGVAMRFAVGDCCLGSLLVAATERGICAIMLGDDPDRLVQDLQDRFGKAKLAAGDELFKHWIAKIVGFLNTPSIGLELPLDIRGTAFQERVWQALRAIPPGSRATYAEIAKRIGRPGGARAVGTACAANPLALAIPCHRVVQSNGSLSGYRWGVQRKRELLRRECR